jgi:CBS domain-containing protein
MRVSRILQAKGSEVATVTPERPVMEVVAELRGRGIGAVVVTAEDGTIAGILSERDIVHALGEHGPEIAHLRARDLMTHEVTICAPGEDVHDVMRRMSGGRFRHVPVVEGSRLAGIISIGDVVRARIEELERETEALQHYITG